MSLIVALGEFAGGELVVEGTPHDIRYRPLGNNWGLLWIVDMPMCERSIIFSGTI